MWNAHAHGRVDMHSFTTHHQHCTCYIVGCALTLAALALDHMITLAAAPWWSSALLQLIRQGVHASLHLYSPDAYTHTRRLNLCNPNTITHMNVACQPYLPHVPHWPTWCVTHPIEILLKDLTQWNRHMLVGGNVTMLGLLYNPQKAMEYPIAMICHAFKSTAHGTTPLGCNCVLRSISAQTTTCKFKLDSQHMANNIHCAPFLCVLGNLLVCHTWWPVCSPTLDHSVIDASQTHRKS